jgi:hypothetical protein
MRHSENPKLARLVVNSLGMVLDSSVLQHSDGELERKGMMPATVLSSFEQGNIRRIHRSILPLLPRQPRLAH